VENNNFYLNMIQLEENARSLYMKFSEICDLRIKKIIINFAEEEENHKKIIKSIFSHLITDVELNDEILMLIQEQELYRKEMEENVFNNRDKDFFVFALGIEKSSINIYSKVLENIKEYSKEYSLFKKLIEEEKKHMIYIIKKIHELK
jgi:Rubrerythrin.